jgi:hypothetical protein
MVIEGAVDRGAITTRISKAGQLSLQDAPRPQFMSDWNIKAAARP